MNAAREAERAAEQAAARRKMASEKRRREALRKSLGRSPIDRQNDIETCAAMPWPPAEPDVVADENARTYRDKTTRTVLACEIAHAADFYGLPLPIDPTSLAVALLTSHDTTLGLDVEAFEYADLSFGRIFGHLYALGFGLDAQLSASITRRTWMVLMDHARARRERSVVLKDSDDNVAMPSVVVAASALVSEVGEELPDEPVDATPERTGEAPKPSGTPHGRSVAGYVRLRERVEFRGAMPMHEGFVLERLAPTDREREELERTSRQGRVEVVVWWDGKPRFVAASLVERVESDAWWAQNAAGLEDQDVDED